MFAVAKVNMQILGVLDVWSRLRTYIKYMAFPKTFSYEAVSENRQKCCYIASEKDVISNTYSITSNLIDFSYNMGSFQGVEFLDSHICRYSETFMITCTAAYFEKIYCRHFLLVIL